MLLAAAAQLASQAVEHPTAEEQRVGVYILAAIFGLLVCGLISIAKEMRAEDRERR